MKVDFFLHNVGEQERGLVDETLQSVFLTTGPRTKKFEEALSAYLGTQYCVGTTSWTMGAFITLKALGIGAGDEVITSPMTFIATGNVILHAGARPVFVDVEPDTGNIDADQIEKAITPKTKAIMPIHLYGQMCDMKKISDIAQRHNLYVIEDSAHCIEGVRDDIRPGQVSDAAVFSFYATKNITCGEGGAIVTNSEDLTKKLQKYRLHGMSKGAAERYSKAYQHWDMELLGYKCNMNDIQASMLLPQLEAIEEIRTRKEAICRRYEEAFAGLEGVTFPVALPQSKHARHIFTIWADPEKRDEVLLKLQEAGIGVAVNFRAIHLLTYYHETFGYKRGDFPVAEKIGDSTITIPLYAKMSNEAVEYVISCVADICS